MNIKNNATLAWGVAAVLALLLIILLVVGRQSGPVNWHAVRTQVHDLCSDPSDKGQKQCTQALGQLNETLIEAQNGLSTWQLASSTASTTEAESAGQ